MAIVRIACLGDVVGKPGRHAVRCAVPVLRAEHGVDVIVVNGENARHGRGLHPVGLSELLEAGADAVTLGDHWFDDERLVTPLRDPAVPVSMPVNVQDPEGGARWTKLPTTPAIAHVSEPIYVLSVIGRLFMPREYPEPFAAVDAAIDAIREEAADALVIVEMHAEATSEKAACAWHCTWKWPGTVVGVTGTHTHVQTSDARILEGHVAAITDLGMCGAHRGVIGFDAENSAARIIEQKPSKLMPAQHDIAADGVLIDIDTSMRRAVRARVISIACPDLPEGD